MWCRCAFAVVRRPLARNVGFRGTGLVIASLVALLAPYLVIKTDTFGIVGREKNVNLWDAGFNLGFSNMGFGVKDLPLDKVPCYLNYLAVFILAFVVLSIDMNVIRRLPTTGNETKDLIIAMTVNVALGIAMVIVIVAVKWWLQSMASPADTNWLWGMGLDTQRIWGLPVGMTVATADSTFIYKKTGNIWLCALLVGTIACIMGVLYGSTRFHYITYFYA